MDDPASYVRTASLRWETLRIAYSSILIIEAAACPAHVREYIAGKLSFGYWGTIVLFLLAANAFFSLGPIFELYVALYLRRGIGRTRYALFACGLYVSTLVVNPCVILPWSK